MVQLARALQRHTETNNAAVDDHRSEVGASSEGRHVRPEWKRAHVSIAVAGAAQFPGPGKGSTGPPLNASFRIFPHNLFCILAVAAWMMRHANEQVG